MMSPSPRRPAAVDTRLASKRLSAEEQRVDDVVAVICTFEPSEELIDTVSVLLAQVERVVIVDDGSSASADAVLDRIMGERVSVRRLALNGGIAAALNVGIEIARAGGAKHLLTMDQDSRLAPQYVGRAVAAIQQLELAGKGVLAVGAGTVNGNCIDPLDPRSCVPILDTLQSGLLFNLESVARIGLFDERLFIDCVDTEYILRGAIRGLETYRAKECALDHALGHSLQARLPGGRSVEFAYHSAWRRYYITRNRVEIVRRYGLRFPKWTVLQGYDQARYFGLVLLFGPRPGHQVLAFGVGLAHGLTSRLGPIPSGLKARLSGTPSAPAGAS